MSQFPQFPRCLFGGTWLVLIALAIAGCKDKPPETPPDEELNLKRLAVFYGQYTSRHKGVPPKTAVELEGFIRTLKPEDLENFKVHDIKKLFVSPRDGQAYVIVPLARIAAPGPGSVQVVAYEQTGKEGKRWVAYSTGGVEEVDETKFNQLVPNKSS